MTAGINRDSQKRIYLDYRQRDRPVLHTTLHRHPQLRAHRVWGRSLCRFARTSNLCAKKTHLCVFLRTHNMPDNYFKVLTALGMHSNKLKLSGRLTVESKLPEMKNPLCRGQHKYKPLCNITEHE